jgi:hypothetical protein
LEEADTNSTQTCSIDVPCTNTKFSYAPCWLEATDLAAANSTTNSTENGNGYYMITYSIEDAFEMDEWGSCDLDNCMV